MSVVVVESPFSGDFERNKLFARHCCRALWERGQVLAMASHLLCPEYLDDRVLEERQAGMSCDIFWRGDAHIFFTDLGVSGGMQRAYRKCDELGIGHITGKLQDYHPASWGAFLLLREPVST